MKQNQNMRVGIIGTGWISDKAAITLNGLQQCEAYAVGSRSQLTADAFAQKWHISRAYGSYAELIADPDVDLIYVGTPHSHHYDVTREALLAGKPCLVEKAFMANVRQTKEIIDLAHERKVFLAEAIWTRYQPVVNMVRDLIVSGRIGTPRLITATLGYPRQLLSTALTVPTSRPSACPVRSPATNTSSSRADRPSSTASSNLARCHTPRPSTSCNSWTDCATSGTYDTQWMNQTYKQ